jgi:glucans biosynthesis protein
MTVRTLPLALLCLAAAAPLRADPPFTFELLRARALHLAVQPYQPRPSPVPTWLRDLTYDQYRDIRFRPPQSWWNHDPIPFKLQFFHPGYIFDRTVQIHEIDEGQVRLIPFSENFFDYGHNHVGPLPASMGYAGFRIHNFLNQPGDELGVFQGASYFRFLCKRAVYGLSARGLSLNTGEPGGEEFPNFEEFWVERPAGAQATSLTVYALMDSPSVTGAYRFVIDPGADTVMHVKAVIYGRLNPGVVGVAPLTSMYWHGKTSNFETDDVRPEVHDSDGLMLETGSGEWLWRPLTNPPVMRTTAFSDTNPRGFGLIQRERRYEAYEDIEASSQLRPSAWVQPVGPWGRGSVRLVELHSPDETNDNIVAFWVPAKPLTPGNPIQVEYDLHWYMDQIRPPSGYTISTRHGRTRTFETNLERFVLDFDGPDLRKLGPDAGVEAMVTVGSGASLVQSNAQKDPYSGAWRAAFALRPDASDQPVELRCYLKRGSEVLTETWSYLWQP